MAEITNPLLTTKIALAYHLWLRVMVWPDVPTLRANNPSIEPDQVAHFQAEYSGKCIGTLHLASTNLLNYVIAHEMDHVIQEFADRAWGERRGQIVGYITAELDAALKRARLL